jgi:hypothetical protein
MPEMPDLVGAWREALGQLQQLSASIAGGTTGAARELLAPLQRQTEIIEQLLRRQIEIEQELMGRAIAPARATAEALDKAPAAMRAQAAAFRAAAASFTQAGELLEVQAAAVEQTITALMAPVHVAQWGLGQRPPDDPPEE